MGYGNEPNDEFIEYVLSALNIFQEGGKDTRDKQSINWVQHFFDAMPGGFFIYRANEEEEIIYANRELLRIFGCDTMEEFRQHTGNSFKGIVHPEDLDEVEKSIWEQIVENQYDLDYVEYRIIQKNGEVRWIDDYGHFVRNKNVGDFFYVFVGDATEKKRRQMEALHYINKERGQYLELIEGLSSHYESLLYVDLEDDSIRAYRLSSRMKKLFHTELEVHNYSWYVGAYVDAWVHPEDRDMVSKITNPEYIQNKLSQVKSFHTIFRVVEKEKIKYLYLRIVDSRKENENKISRFVMGYRDMDGEIRQERERQEMLEDALKQANSAVLAKDVFLANMSHDLLTPMNAIVGFTTLAKKHMDDSERLAYDLDKIRISSGQLLRLLNDVLEIANIEARKMQVKEEECNLFDIVRDVQRQLLPLAAAKNIMLSVDMDDFKHNIIFSDKTKLSHILLRLTNNAIRYTDIGGRIIVIIREMRKISESQSAFQFIVEDNGIGISESLQKNIFEPFQRGKNTTLSGISGTGLGLTIVKSLVEKLGGSIQVESTVGVGSRFTVSLNLNIQDVPSSSYSPGYREPSFDKEKKRRLLVVEDTEINLEIEVELLQDAGFLVDTAVNGSIAVEKIKNSRPGEYDLVIMDIQMPVMNGYDATGKIRQLEDPELANIPIIALSANTFEEDRRKSRESGMNAHVPKPIDITRLVEVIMGFLE